MVKLYKITDSNGMTGHEHNLMRWGENVTHKVSGVAPFPRVKVLCTSHVIHAYISREMASFIHPVHISYGKDGILWEAEGDIVVQDNYKVGVTELTTIKKVDFVPYTWDNREEISNNYDGGSSYSLWDFIHQWSVNTNFNDFLIKETKKLGLS